VAIKAGLAYAPPHYYGGLRALIGGAALLPVLVVLREPLLSGRRHWPWVLALALISTSVAFGAMFLSPTRTEAGIASVLGNTQPLFAVVLAALFLGERVTTGKLVALRSGIAGVTLISYASFSGPGGPGGPGEPDAYGVAGAVLALAAAGAAAGGSVTLKRMGAGCPLLTVAAWQLVVGSLPLLAASSVLEAGRHGGMERRVCGVVALSGAGGHLVCHRPLVPPVAE
jgi:drug/metabolite transporter (DMT)-like permease